MEEDNSKYPVRCIVDSVKGGCGKTTLAIMLSLLFSESIEAGPDVKVDPNSEVTLFDMDLTGSSLEHLLFNGKIREAIEGPYILKAAKSYINDAVSSPDTIKGDFLSALAPSIEKNESEDTSNKEITTLSVTRRVFNVAVADEDINIRSKYLSPYTQYISLDLFKNGVLRISKELVKQGNFLPQRYQVFDMSPGIDSQSMRIFDDLLRLDPKYKGTVNYFLVTTCDKGHIKTTIDYLEWILTARFGTLKSKHPNNIFVIFNNIHGQKTGCDALKKDYSGRIGEFFPTGADVNIYLCFMERNEEYLKADLGSGDWSCFNGLDKKIECFDKIGSNSKPPGFQEIFNTLKIKRSKDADDASPQ